MKTLNLIFCVLLIHTHIQQDDPHLDPLYKFDEPDQDEFNKGLDLEAERVAKLDIDIQISPTDYFWDLYRCKCKKGLTWVHRTHYCGTDDNPLNLDHVSCHGGAYPCDPYYGDTECHKYLPILCINKSNIPRPVHWPCSNPFYCGWTGGIIRLSRYYRGCYLQSKEHADKLCQKEFGCNYEMASHHDGKYIPSMTPATTPAQWISAPVKYTGGWSHASLGNIFNYQHSASSINQTRFWVYIRDQYGNCWK